MDKVPRIILPILCVGTTLSSLALTWIPLEAIKNFAYLGESLNPWRIFNNEVPLVWLAGVFVVFGYYLTLRFWKAYFGFAVTGRFWTIASLYYLIAAILPLAIITIAVVESVRGLTGHSVYFARGMEFPATWFLFAAAASFYLGRRLTSLKLP